MGSVGAWLRTKTLNDNPYLHQAAEQLEITFPSAFSIGSSKPTTAFLVCQKENVHSGTILKAQIQGNKLIIEKLSIYDGKGTVMVFLASGFIGEAAEAQLAPVPSAKITMSAKDYTYSAYIGKYANCIQDNWGMLYILMSSWAYAPGVENEYNITGLPAEICIDVPAFSSNTNSGLDGSDCVVAHIENGKITFTAKGKEGDRKQYLNRAFMKLFFVRETAETGE